MTDSAPGRTGSDTFAARLRFLGGPASVMILLLVLATVLWDQMTTLERMTREARTLPVVNGETVLEFYTGGRFVLHGSWQLTDALEGPRALVFTTRQREFLLSGDSLGVLDAGAVTPRHALSFSETVGSSGFDAPRMLAWVEDGDALVGWFDETRQLCRVDAATGRVTSLASFPSEWTIGSSTEEWKLDHPIIRRRGGLVEDREQGRVLFLEALPEPAGGYALVSVALAGGDVQRPFVEKPFAGNVLSWELSLDRGELFVLVETAVGQELRVHDYRGHRSRTLDLPATGALGIHLSPDERTLLVERKWKPASAALDRVELDRWARPSTAEEWRRYDARYGGFALIDLVTNTRHAGPTTGRNAAWNPDGSAIAYMDGSELRLWDVATSEIGLLARSEGDSPDDRRSSCGHVPQWSPDGKALLTCCSGTSELVVLDLDRRSFVMLYAGDSDHLWASSGRPLDW